MKTIRPLTQAKNIFDELHVKLNDYFIELLIANDNCISIRKEVLMQTSSMNNDPTETYAPYFIEEVKYEDGCIHVFQSKNGQFIDFGSSFNFKEKELLITEAAKAAENEAAIEFFPITSVAREDLRYAHFNAKKVSNEDMEKLATKMSEIYVENYFWDNLEDIAGELGFPTCNRYVMGWSQDEDEIAVVYANSLKEAQEIFKTGDCEWEKPEKDAWLEHAHEILDECFPDADEGIKDDFACEHWQSGMNDVENCESFKEYLNTRQS